MSYSLEKYSLPELKKMGSEMDLAPRRSKSQMIKDIERAFQEYEEYKQEKIDRYTRLQKLGEGKEGTVYLVKDSKNNKEYVMKTFRKTKSSSKIKLEYTLQKKASKKGVCPKVIDYDTVSKYIVMERLEHHFLDELKKQKGNITKKQQERILEIFKKLDEAGVLHGDANLANYMMKEGQIYLIDYGFAKEINNKLKKKLKTDSPNEHFMLVGFILKLRELEIEEKSYKYLSKALPKNLKEKYGLESKPKDKNGTLVEQKVRQEQDVSHNKNKTAARKK